MIKTDRKDFQKLNPTDRARIISVSKLTTHFRGLENAGLLNQEVTSKYIGAIRILEAMATGTFKEKIQEIPVIHAEVKV